MKKLLNYVESIVEFEEGHEEFLRVTDIGKVVTTLVGTNKNVLGRTINEMLIAYNYQENSEDSENIEVLEDENLEDLDLFDYIPTNKFKHYIMVERETEDSYYGIIKWHYTIIPKLLNIDFSLNIADNISRVEERLKKFVSEYYIIDKEVLAKELKEIGIKK